MRKRKGGFAAAELMLDISSEPFSERRVSLDCQECGMGYWPCHPGCKHRRCTLDGTNEERCPCVVGGEELMIELLMDLPSSSKTIQ